MEGLRLGLDSGRDKEKCMVQGQWLGGGCSEIEAQW